MRLPALPLCCAALLLAAAAPIRLRPPSGAVMQVDAKLGTAAADTDFLFRLGMLEGHLMIGRELLDAKRPELAMPHFGHPVRELYDDISGYLSKRSFAAFDTDLAVLEAAVATKPDAPATMQKFNAVIDILHRARLLAPESIRASVPAMMKICADTMDAASGEYNGALERGRIASIVEYHDSRGFLEYVGRQIKEMMGRHTDAASQAVLGRFRDVLVKAEWIVGPLLPDPTPRASVGQYRALAEQAAAIAAAK